MLEYHISEKQIYVAILDMLFVINYNDALIIKGDIYDPESLV